ncbi:MAG: FecR domain-containing protein [Flavitalea sp.]
MDYIPRLNTLLDKYLNDLCSAHEKNEMISLLIRAEEDRIVIPGIREIWTRLKMDDIKHSVDWDNMYAVVTSAEQRITAFGHLKKKASRRSWPVLAATILLFFIAAVAFYFSRPAIQMPTQPAMAVNKTSFQETVSKYRSIHLPDGSLVILFPGSSLEHPRAFKGKTREVSLTGEGYFDIAHLAGMPFIVHTGKISTRVLGTAFDIKAYPGDASIEVTVKRGKVEVLNERKSIGLLTANQMISFTKQSEKYEQRKIPAATYAPSISKETFFDNITMKEAAIKIEALFHVPVELINADMEKCRVTATFSEKDNLEEILTVICGVTRAKFHVANNLVIIEGAGCSN